MKIKRTSWHYKISNLWSTWENNDDNLCCYFWRLVGKSFLCVFGFAVVCAYFYMFWVYHYTGALFIGILFIAGCILIPYFTIMYIRNKLGKVPVMPGEDIVFEFLAAKKSKYCPLIEYID